MWNFRDLLVWRRTRTLVTQVFDATADFPPEHRFGLSSQLQRAANSIGANIAEACGRPSRKDRARLLGISIGSANETEHHLIIAADVALVTPERASTLIREVDEIRRVLKALHARCLRSDV